MIVPERRSAPLAGTVAKTSAGALSLVPILEVTNLARTLDQFKHSGIWIVGLDAASRLTVFDSRLHRASGPRRRGRGRRTTTPYVGKMRSIGEPADARRD